MNPFIKNLETEIQPIKDSLLSHPVYQSLDSIEKFRVFMEHHVYAVWDFMNFLKVLQNAFTGLSVPWVPVGDPKIRRMINEIVLGEESDEDGEGNFLSHYELYIQAMKVAGAETTSMETLMNLLQNGESFDVLLEKFSFPGKVQAFLKVNWEIIQKNSLPMVAGAFTYGREGLIPDMFRQIVNQVINSAPEQLSPLKYYFERHIHLDEEEHLPLAQRMLVLLCGESEEKWEAARQGATLALNARKDLWDGLLAEYSKNEVKAMAS